MASFSQFITPLLTREGGYVNDPLDRGGETYQGISRRNWPNWDGWTKIDQRKPVKKGQVFSDLTNSVLKFYQTSYWLPVFGADIRTQAIADILADWKINGGYTVEKLQAILKKLGSNIAVDGMFGPITLQAVNTANQKALLQAIKDERAAWYAAIVRNDPSQQRFYNGWLARLKEFALPTMTGIGVVLFAVGLFALLKNK